MWGCLIKSPHHWAWAISNMYLVILILIVSDILGPVKGCVSMRLGQRCVSIRISAPEAQEWCRAENARCVPHDDSETELPKGRPSKSSTDVQHKQDDPPCIKYKPRDFHHSLPGMQNKWPPTSLNLLDGKLLKACASGRYM